MSNKQTRVSKRQKLQAITTRIAPGYEVSVEKFGDGVHHFVLMGAHSPAKIKPSLEAEFQAAGYVVDPKYRGGVHVKPRPRSKSAAR